MDLHSHIFECMPDAMIVVGADGRIRMANGRVSSLLGYRPAELVGQWIEALVPESKAAAHQGFRERYMSTPIMRRMGAAQMRLRARRKDGSEFPADIMLSPYQENGETVILCALRDISERAALEEELLKRTAELEHMQVQLTELASRDALTELHNRRSFLEQFDWMLRNAARRGEPVSILMIDLDRFKLVNDRHGHAEGDRVLCAVARAISGACRQSDVPARYGGEEFAVALPDTDVAGSLVLAESMRQAIERIAGFQEPITASFGIASWAPQVGTATAQDVSAMLVATADRALYAAKAAGRNCVRHADAICGAPHLSI